jgi:hypothetical protein
MMPTLIFVPGPDAPPPSPDELFEGSWEWTNPISRAVAAVVPRYVSGYSGALIDRPTYYSSGTVEFLPKLIDMFTGPLEVFVSRRGEPGTWPTVTPLEGDDWTEHWPPHDSEPVSALGSGARRAIAMACVEAYTDENLWPPSLPLFVVLEEPEVGLHASALRRMAKAIRQLARHGVQVLVVTHAPTLINAAPRDGLRILRVKERTDAAPDHAAGTQAPTARSEALLAGGRPGRLRMPGVSQTRVSARTLLPGPRAAGGPGHPAVVSALPLPAPDKGPGRGSPRVRNGMVHSLSAREAPRRTLRRPGQ